MTSKTTDIYGPGVIQKPVIADLEVKEIKVTGTADRREGISLEAVKYEAVAIALKIANADVLVEPKFETSSIGARMSATVTGFPATYKNFRIIKTEDIPLLQAGVTQKANVYSPAITEKKRKSMFATIATVIGAIGIGGLLGAGIGLGLQ